jgi:hypothetical protein
LGSQLPQRPTGGLLVSWGCWYLPGGVKMTCNKFLQNRPKNRNSTQSDRPTLCVCFFLVFFRGPLAHFKLFLERRDARLPQGASAKKNNKEESVGCFYVGWSGIAFFGLFCKNLLHVILTPPARYQHPHDANNPQVGHWGNCGNCEPKWWPQGSTSSSSKTKQRTHKR